MGWRTTGVTLAALAVAGCLGATPSASPEASPAVWEAKIPSPLGERIPVTLTDFTGLVTGVGDGDRVLAGISSGWMALWPSPDDDPGIAVSLIGSPCERAFELAVSAVGDLVMVSWTPSPRSGCDAMAVTYQVGIALSAPIEPSRLLAHDFEEDESRDRRASWGFLVPGGDGLSRPVKVLDERAVLLSATPLDLASLPVVTGHIGVDRPHGREDLTLLAWASEACHEEMILTVFPGRATTLHVSLPYVDAARCGGPTHLQGVSLTFHPSIDTVGIEAVVNRNR